MNKNNENVASNEFLIKFYQLCSIKKNYLLQIMTSLRIYELINSNGKHIENVKPRKLETLISSNQSFFGISLTYIVLVLKKTHF